MLNKEPRQSKEERARENTAWARATSPDIRPNPEVRLERTIDSLDFGVEQVIQRADRMKIEHEDAQRAALNAAKEIRARLNGNALEVNERELASIIYMHIRKMREL